MHPVETFKKNFNLLNISTLHLISEIYSADIHFIDPLHEIRGIGPLTTYFENLYDGVASCRFDFEPALMAGDQAALPWVMHLEHRRLRPGETVAVPGISHLKFNATHIVRHQDYFDLGKLLYERIPALGFFVRTIKKRL